MRFSQFTVHSSQYTMGKEIVVLSEAKNLEVLVEVGDRYGL